MKNRLISFLILSMCLTVASAYGQSEGDTTLLGLPGDNLDLFAVLNIFQKSKTIEEFEKTLNLKETGVNNLDLDLNDTVDFIKVVTKQDGTDFSFILQVDVSAKEIQDVAVIFVSKDKDGKVIMQIVGDKDLYGKDYVIEPAPPAPAVTPNPAYAGTDPVPAAAPASTTVVVVEQTPIVQYVYSPVYVPYYPPYYYRYYPPYFAAFTVMAVGIYHHNNYYHHGGYHGGHGGTVVIHNDVNFNNYNNTRNVSNTVNHNNVSGNYNRSNASARPSTGTTASTRPSTGTSASTRPSTGTSASTRPSTGTSSSTRPSTGTSSSNRPSTGTSASTYSGGSRGSGSYGGSTGSSSRSGSGYSNSGYSGASRGGMSRGGGGRR